MPEKHKDLVIRGWQIITAIQEKNFLTLEMYGAASIGEQQQVKLQYTYFAGFMRFNFPLEWLIKTVYGDPSNLTSDQIVINTHIGTHTKIAIISLLKPLCCVAKIVNTYTKITV